ALNEEEMIERSVRSAIEALHGLKGEVILADSLSDDRTVDIAGKYPIRIVQITDRKDRSCGVGPELGFQHAKGDYIYILDADMELEPGFLEAAKDFLDSTPGAAGVGGRIHEMTDTNLVFSRRKKDTGKDLGEVKESKSLMMGGLYRRKAIEAVGHFSNPNLHAYEESDLALRLREKGYKLFRMPVDMIRHYGDRKSSIDIVFGRFRSRYLMGCGEFLRAHLMKPTFLPALAELRIYVLVILWWAILFMSAAAAFFWVIPLLSSLAATVLFMLAFLIKKKSVKEASFSIFSWNMTALGLIIGFLAPQKRLGPIPAKVIK
ncbi:MAG: glycosyltransferase, partial [Nanoarchaeota archaeon]|nr:glycosyltransferase [Nanoarchaeota archaeon]